MTTLAENIKKMRTARGLTQSKVAESVGISRPSYISIEKGRDISFQEAEKLSRVLGVTVEELREGAAPDYFKYREMVLAFLRIASGDGKLPKTKLAKYLYLADFAWFYKHLESMSGMAYRRIPYGPVPDQFFRAVEELEMDGLVKVERKNSNGQDVHLVSLTRAGQKKKLEKLGKKERDLMKRVEKKWHDAPTQEIVAFTHNQLPYAIAQDGEVIPYALITQEEPDHVFY